MRLARFRFSTAAEEKPRGVRIVKMRAGYVVANYTTSNNPLGSWLLVHYVHCHFEAEAHLCCSWFCPHNISPVICDKQHELLAIKFEKFYTSKP